MRRSLLSALTLMILSIVICLGLFEAVLRLSGVQKDFFYQLDPDVGAMHIPGKKGWHIFAEGKQYIEINAHGYRDRGRTIDKKRGTRRIAVLGDSFVEAFQVPLESTFTWHLEQMLKEECADGPDFEVLSFGVSGFGTGQELETLRHRVLAFAPDAVLLYFHPSNDLYDNSRELDIEPNRLHFDLNDNGQLVRLPFHVSDSAPKQWLRRYSKAYLFLRDRIKKLSALQRVLQVMHLMQKQVPMEDNDTLALARRMQLRLYQLPPSPALERAWRLTEALLAEFQQLTDDKGLRFGVAVIPSREEILNRSHEAVSDQKNWDFQQLLHKSREICTRLKIDCRQLIDVFRASDSKLDENYFPLDGHWTKSGRALVEHETLAWVRG